MLIVGAEIRIKPANGKRAPDADGGVLVVPAVVVDDDLPLGSGNGSSWAARLAMSGTPITSASSKSITSRSFCSRWPWDVTVVLKTCHKLLAPTGTHTYTSTYTYSRLSTFDLTFDL